MNVLISTALLSLALSPLPVQDAPDGDLSRIDLPEGWSVNSMKRALHFCELLIEHDYVDFDSVGPCISDMNRQFTINCGKEDFRRHMERVYRVKIDKKGDCIRTMRGVVTGKFE